MNQFFEELFEYSHHYNQELAQVFLNNPEKVSAKALSLLSHILNAHHIWNNRIEGRQPRFAVWDLHQAAELPDIDQNNYELSLQILKKVDLNERIDYTTTKGQAFNSSIRDIYFHAINHSTYHRAQIATEFKTNGLDPLLTDYIFYRR